MAQRERSHARGDFGSLLRSLARNLSSGTVRARARAPQKLLHHEAGVVRWIYTPASRFRLGGILYRARAVERDTLRDALREQKHTRRRLGEILVSRGAITERQLRDALAYRLVEEVLEIFFWDGLSFEFLGEDPASVAAEVMPGGATAIEADMDAEVLVRRVEKVIRDLDELSSVMPSLRDVYELTEETAEWVFGEAGAALDEGLRELLRLIDGERDMQEVLRQMRMNRFDVLELFYRLRCEGKIRAKNGFELLMLAENRRDQLSVHKRRRLYERVRALGVEGFEISLRLAEICLELGERRRAAGYYVEMGKKALASGDCRRAVDGAHRAIELFPDHVRRRASLVDVLERGGHGSAAAVELRGLAELYAGRGWAERAIEALERSHGLVALPETLERLGELRGEAGDGAGARAAYREAARVRAAAGDSDRALDDLRLGAEADLGFLPARLELAEACARAGRTGEAEELLASLARAVVERAPEDRTTRDVLRFAAETALRLDVGAGEAAPACAVALEHIGATARAAELWSAVAAARRAAGRPGAATEALAAAARLEPDDDGACERLARAHEEAGDDRMAADAWRDVAERRTARGDRAGAAHAWESLLDVAPFDVAARREWAKACEADGRIADAVEAWRTIADLEQIARHEDARRDALDRAERLESPAR